MGYIRKLLYLYSIAILVIFSGMTYAQARNNEELLKGLETWRGTIIVTIEKIKCDPNGDWGDGLYPAPDLYYRVAINNQVIFSNVWSDTYEVLRPWSASFKINTRDKFVWIQIAVFDADTNLDDYIIDIDPSDGFALDLLLSLTTGHWTGDTTSTQARGNLPINWAEIYFNIMLDPIPIPKDLIDPNILSLNYSGLYMLGSTVGNIFMRIENFSFELSIINPTSITGYIYIHFTNLDPDFITFDCKENYTSRGNYSVTIEILIGANSKETIIGKPWYVTENVWFFAISDNQPGSGVSELGIEDAPYPPTKEYLVFAYYFTDVINPLWGVNAGDVTGGYGGGVIIDETPYNGLPPYDTQFREFYMVTGLKSCFYFSAVGNHDNSRYSWMPRHHAENTRKEYLGNKYYSFSYSHTHTLIIDSYEDNAWSDGTNWWEWNEEPTYGGYVYGEQLLWIKSDLSKHKNYSNKIAVFHIPIVNKPDGDHTINDEFFNKTNARELMEIFLQYNLTCMIVGHIHNYSFYYTYLDGNDVSSSYTPVSNSISTLMIGGGGAHNEAEWLFPPIEGSYHFALVNTNRNSFRYYIFKYEEITDSSGKPLTAIRFVGSNDGTSDNLIVRIYNNASVSLPYIRIKAYMKKGYFYAALSSSTNTYENLYQKDFKDYTVVYVETNVSAREVKEIRIHSVNISGHIENSYDVEITDSVVELLHNFTYTGNVPAKIRFRAESDLGWNVKIYLLNGSPLSEILMLPGNSISFIVNVSVESGCSNISVEAYYQSYLIDKKIDRVRRYLSEKLLPILATLLPIIIIISKKHFY